MWRFIPFQYYDPYERIAFNEQLHQAVIETGQPIISLTGWNKPCVNIGYGQKVSEVVNLSELKKRNTLLVRRHGGGGATYLSTKDICWGIIAPESYFPPDLNEIYVVVAELLCKALSRMGISAKHKPINDVVTQNGKISGASIVKKEGVIYISGTLLYDVDKDILESLLQPENDYLKKSKSESDKKVTSISAESAMTFTQAVDILTETLLEDKVFEKKYFTPADFSSAKERAKFYSSSKWLYHNE